MRPHLEQQQQQQQNQTHKQKKQTTKEREQDLGEVSEVKENLLKHFLFEMSQYLKNKHLKEGRV